MGRRIKGLDEWLTSNPDFDANPKPTEDFIVTDNYYGPYTKSQAEDLVREQEYIDSLSEPKIRVNCPGQYCCASFSEIFVKFAIFLASSMSDINNNSPLDDSLYLIENIFFIKSKLNGSPPMP